VASHRPGRLRALVELPLGSSARVDVLFCLSATAYFNRLEDISDEEWDPAPRDEVELFRRDEGVVTCGG
jgi:hypothetical protein